MTERSIFRLIVRAVGFVLLLAGLFEGISSLLERAFSGEWQTFASDVVYYKIETTLMCVSFGSHYWSSLVPSSA